ncbi:MAG: hypothetical protein FWG62_10090 [Proteobacteria bacterium]|nr:hypothetical protein [Pseudomonadota bacterium]
MDEQLGPSGWTKLIDIKNYAISTNKTIDLPSGTIVAKDEQIQLPINLTTLELITMNMTSPKKKLMLAAILTSGLTLAISQASLAEPAKQISPDQQTNAPAQALMNTDMRKAHDKFLDDTVALRKELAEKRAVMRALMNAGTPDTVKASQVAGELFDLGEKLRAKAKEAGLPLPMFRSMGGDESGCQGMMGHGMREGHHRAFNK